ncbi:MAG: EamA family transporter [Acidobacteriota bacterium]|nr:EamA family transporter [Acidobacteriota bacterium]
MSRGFLGHSFIFATILFTVYSQIIMRWQVGHAGPLPVDLSGRVGFVAHLLTNFWVLSGLLATFLAGISWMLAMTRFEISYAYPFVALNYLLVLAFSVVAFNESLSMPKLAGTVLIVIGIIFVTRG